MWLRWGKHQLPLQRAVVRTKTRLLFFIQQVLGSRPAPWARHLPPAMSRAPHAVPGPGGHDGAQGRSGMPRRRKRSRPALETPREQPHQAWGMGSAGGRCAAPPPPHPRACEHPPLPPPLGPTSPGQCSCFLPGTWRQTPDSASFCPEIRRYVPPTESDLL